MSSNTAGIITNRRVCSNTLRFALADASIVSVNARKIPVGLRRYVGIHTPENKVTVHAWHK